MPSRPLLLPTILAASLLLALASPAVQAYHVCVPDQPCCEHNDDSCFDQVPAHDVGKVLGSLGGACLLAETVCFQSGEGRLCVVVAEEAACIAVSPGQVCAFVNGPPVCLDVRTGGLRCVPGTGVCVYVGGGVVCVVVNGTAVCVP